MKNFRAAQLQRYTVICLVHQFGNSEHSLSKRFVVVGHRDGYAICLKATSKVKVYLNNKESMAGCVFYEGGELPCFEKDTAIQPDNQIPISHAEIESAHRENCLDILDQLPRSFEKALIQATRNSVTISNRERKRLLSILEGD